MSKAKIRKKNLELRKQFSELEINIASSKILHNLRKLNLLTYDYFHCFLTIESKSEVQTSQLIDFLLENSKKVISSRSDFTTHEMVNYFIDKSIEFEISKYGIPEPPTNCLPCDDNLIQVVFVPLLACDNNGNRVGYGAGFYDRFFKRSKNSIKIGLSFFETEDQAIEVNPNDVALDILVTPNNIYHFSDKNLNY